jgi:chorismate mutase
MKIARLGTASRTLGFAAMMSCFAPSAMAASPAESLEELIDAAAYRLSIADQVALTKWDSRKPVEDLPREKVVIDKAVEQATSHGLSTGRTADVFADQIEANKLVQYELLALWERVGNAPADPRPDLVRDIRPRLDVLQGRLINGLIETSTLAARADCPRVVANSVGIYINSKRLDTVHAIALDRATARFCEK